MTTGRQPAATAEKKRAETQLSPAGERQKIDVAISRAIRSTSELSTAHRQMYARRRPGRLLPVNSPPPSRDPWFARLDRWVLWLSTARAPSCSALAVHGLPLRDAGTIGRTMTLASSPLSAAAYSGAMAQRIARPVQHTSSAPAK
jgi:hypothetical protein